MLCSGCSLLIVAPRLSLSIPQLRPFPPSLFALHSHTCFVKCSAYRLLPGFPMCGCRASPMTSAPRVKMAGPPREPTGLQCQSTLSRMATLHWEAARLTTPVCPQTTMSPCPGARSCRTFPSMRSVAVLSHDGMTKVWSFLELMRGLRLAHTSICLETCVWSALLVL